MHRLRKRARLAVLLSVSIACCGTPPRLQQLVPFERPEAGFSILLMPADVQLEERGLIGSEARIDWAAGARQTAEALVREILEAKNIAVSVFLATDIEASQAQEAAAAQQRLIFRQLAERSAYGRRAGYIFGARPSSLRFESRDLRQASDVRYALFLALRDRYSSTGRVVGQVALGALFIASIVFLGVPLTPLDLEDAGPRYSRFGAPAMNVTSPGSGCLEQMGYASLVDLDSGDVVWLNSISNGCFDLRDPDELRNTLKLLLSGLA